MLQSPRLIKVLAVTAGLILLAGCGQTGPKPPGKYADLAKCLTEKGVIMYGSYWCQHCQSQKEAFGDDVQFLPYQECDDSGKGGDHKVCLEAGVTSYPTWYFPGQGNLVGSQPLYLLGKLSNCQDKLPPEDKQQLLEAEKLVEQASAAKTGETAATTPPAGQTGVPEPVGRAPVTTDTAAPATN